MASVNIETIKDHGDGEKHIRVTADFTIYYLVNSINDVRAAIEKEIDKYAI